MRAKQLLKRTPKPSVLDSNVLEYLNAEPGKNLYLNTALETKLVGLWDQKYVTAKEEFNNSRCNPEKLKVWRDAFLGNFKELNDNGTPTTKSQRAIKKMAYEMVQDKVNPHIPMPKMTPRYHSDIQPVNATEALIKQEMDKMLSEETHDESERATLIDSTSWFKVSWNPFDNTHERSGMPTVELCPVDKVFPQPGISNYKKLEYVFEDTTMTLSQVQTMYNRKVKSKDNNDLVEVVECYYLNQDRHVGKFVWVSDCKTVLANDLEWGMRRRRECTECHKPVTIDPECPACGSDTFEYVGVKSQELEADLNKIVNKYRSGTSLEEKDDETKVDEQSTIPAGTKIPFYLIRQLPYVPKRTMKIVGDMYGMSEVQVHLEPQDAVNKLLNKAVRKSQASKAYATKLKDTRTDSSDNNSEITWIEVESAQEGQAIQVKQIMSDITEEMVMSNNLYDSSKGTAGITATDQGQNDPSAKSGKAKQVQLAASSKRKASPNVQRNAAYAGVYELIFKYLLAFSDEERSFVSLMPDGSEKEEVWSKYMFIDTDKDGNFYYRDDFAFSVDNASEITQDRASMWQLIDNDFMNGVMGTEIDPTRALQMYWHMKNQAGYPTAKFAIAFLENAIKHLPTSVEQALVNDPEAVELALSYMEDKATGKAAAIAQKQQADAAKPATGGPQGGARAGAGKPSNNSTKTQQQGAANNKTRSAKGQTTNTTATKTGGQQGGTE
jgi:hypothetical protein